MPIDSVMPFNSINAGCLSLSNCLPASFSTSVLISCPLDETWQDALSRKASLVWMGKVALNLGAATVICLRAAAYFSFRVFLSPVAHYQYGVSVARLPGHLHLFHRLRL